MDGGAPLTSMPRAALERRGLKPVTKRRLRTYGGGVVEREIGGTVVEYEGRRAIVPMIFGEPEGVPVPGANALESLVHQMDTASRKSKPIESLMV